MKIILHILLFIFVSFICISCYPSGFGTGLGGVGNKESMAMNGVSFKDNTSTNYGFDAKLNETETYISAKMGSYLTGFVVELLNIPKGEAKTSDANCVTITSGNTLIDGDNPIVFRSGTVPTSGKIDIAGCTGESSVSSCYVPKNSINVKVYWEKTTNLNLKVLNNANFNSNSIENKFNEVLKQAVYRIASMNYSEDPFFPQSSYDLNNNGYLDLWFCTTTPVPADDEFEGIKQANASVWRFGPGLVVVKNNIRTHLLIQFDMNAGVNKINVNRGDEVIFKTGDWLFLGPVKGATGIEKMWVSSVIPGAISIQRGQFDNLGTRYPHLVADHTIWSDYKSRGTCDDIYGTNDNFAVLGENASQKDAIHEFLHMKISGNLLHVVDVDNIMNENVDNPGLALRCRKIANPYGESDQEQWDMIQP